MKHTILIISLLILNSCIRDNYKSAIAYQQHELNTEVKERVISSSPSKFWFQFTDFTFEDSSVMYLPPMIFWAYPHNVNYIVKEKGTTKYIVTNGDDTSIPSYW